jgi:hypothetical protein
MWRDQLDAFWDGGRALALGFFDGAERSPAFGARPDLVVVSSKAPDFSEETALVDLIDAGRWRAGHCVVELPRDHFHVALRAPDGSELRLALTGENSGVAGGEWRLLLVLTPEGSPAETPVFRVASVSARGDFDRLAREHVVQSGSRLVWAMGQKRNIERRDGAARQAHLWPTRRVFPVFQSRIALEPVEFLNENGADAQAAPFAIMDCWLRENGAPRVILRLRVPDSLDESANLLNRASVVLVMHQRRRLRDWIRDQKEAGDAIIDPLSFDDIRQATGEIAEHPDAVEAPDAIAVGNLLKLVTDPTETEFEGFTARRLAEASAPGLGAAVDIEFYGAALGDDVGLVSASADAGDFGVTPIDPGGASYIRLFRVEGDGLRARRIGDDDPLLEEILRRTADQESVPTGAMARSIAERAASLRGRREKFVASLNAALARAGFPGRFEASGAWDTLEPLMFSSFAALVGEAGAPARALLNRFGGYAAYRADPSLLAAMLRRPEFVQGASGGPASSQGLAASYDGDDRPLVYRYASACGAEGIVAPGLDLPAQLQSFRVLMNLPNSPRLRMARLALTGEADIDRDAASAADALHDEAAVERAAAYFEETELADAATALRDYLAARREGGWTSMGEAQGIASLVARAASDLRQAEVEAAAAEAAPPPEPPPKPKGFFAAVRGLFGGGG